MSEGCSYFVQCTYVTIQYVTGHETFCSIILGGMKHFLEFYETSGYDNMTIISTSSVQRFQTLTVFGSSSKIFCRFVLSGCEWVKHFYTTQLSIKHFQVDRALQSILSFLSFFPVPFFVIHLWLTNMLTNIFYVCALYCPSQWHTEIKFVRVLAGWWGKFWGCWQGV